VRIRLAAQTLSFRSTLLSLGLLLTLTSLLYTIGVSAHSKAKVTAALDNHPPVAHDSSYSMHITQGFIGPLYSYDQDGDSLTPSIITQPSHGTLYTNDYGPLRPWYSPTVGYAGDDSFVYQICDPSNACATGTVTIHILNQAPTAINGSCYLHNPGFIGPFNGYDPDGDSLTPSIISQPSHGTLYTSDHGAWMPWYSPNPGFAGQDSYVQQVCDPFGACASATITISVINQPPVTKDGLYQITNGNGGFIGTFFAWDPDSDGITASIVSQPTHGTLYTNDFGALNPWYSPNPGYTGPDSLIYQICDYFGGCARGTIYINNDDANAGAVSCNANVGEPINVTNGNMYLQETDYHLPATGEAIDITRTYNSNSPYVNLFGRGWSTAYDEKIKTYSNVGPRLFLPDGRAISFSGYSTFTPVQGDFHGQLVRNGNGSFTVTFQDGRVHQFNAAGKLISLADRNNNQTTLTYDANNQLASVTDSSGNTLSVTSGVDGRVQSISDASGVIATYSYGSSGTNSSSQSGSTLLFSDDFNDNVLDTGKWRRGDITGRIYSGASAEDLSVPVQEQNQRLEITPRTNVASDHWNAYLSASAWNISNSRVSVEVPQVTNMSVTGVNTGLAVVIDPQNWYMIYSDNGYLYLDKVVANVRETTSIAYNSGSQRFWAIRHDQPTDTIIFETSPDGVTWTARRTVGRQLPLGSMKIELSAGTWQGVASPGVAVFDNLKLELNTQPPSSTDQVNDQLLSVTHADNSVYQFSYNSSNLLSSVTDALGNVVESHLYDAQGRALTSERQGGVEHFTLNYVSGTQTDVTDALGHATKYFFDKSKGHNVVTRIEGSCACSPTNVQTWTYDNQLNVLTRTDASSQTTTFTYDGYGNPLTATNTLGTVQLTYNGFGEVLTATDPMQGVVTNTYDAHGNLLTTKDALNNTTTFTYDTRGQLQTVKDARNNVTALTWDTGGRLAEARDAANNSTTYVYDARGRVTSVTNALNEATGYEYDSVGRTKKVIYPDTSYVQFTYDLSGRRTKVRDARGNETNFAYDGANRLTSMTNADNKTTSYGYNLMSRLMSLTDALNRTTNYEYDDFNRLVKTIYPAATNGAARLEERVEYDAVGQVKKQVDTGGRETLYNYDTSHRLIKVTDPALKATQYEYNARSQTTAVVDALNQRYEFSYDPLGRVTQVTRGSVSMSYSYDAVGNRTARTDYNNATTSYAYDNLNRLTTTTYPDTTTVNYAYDQLSRLSSATNANGTVGFGYDNRGRVSSSTDVFNQSVGYIYDANGNRTGLTLGQATNATYQYDVLNRLAQLTDGGNAATTYAYDATNKLTSRTLPNGVTSAYQYDGIDRLTRLTDATSTSTVADAQYQYNTASQITQIAEPTQTRNFSYDAADRLTTVQNPTQTIESYTYDGVGNRTASHQSSSYSYQPFNKVVTIGSNSYSYDSNGNLTQKTDGTGTWIYSWDYENRLKQVTRPDSTTISYKYDALGRRIQRSKSAGGSTNYIYDGEDVVKDINSDGSVVDYLNGLGIDDKLRQTNSSGTLYFTKDHLNSTRALTDSNGSVVESISYDSFGNGSSSLTRYGYTGREWDADSNLYYYRNRWYDSQVGRFISEDPIGLDGGINPYAYVENDPIMDVDPLGLQKRSGRNLPVATGHIQPAPRITPPAPNIRPNLRLVPSPALEELGTIGRIAAGVAGAVITLEILYLTQNPQPGSIMNPLPALRPDGTISCTTGNYPRPSSIRTPIPDAIPFPPLPWNMGKKWTCIATCNIQNYSNVPNAPDRVTGGGSGSSEEEACLNAKRNATQQAPLGTYPRHCQCECDKR
jgi:RHS repeat-associated protein